MRRESESTKQGDQILVDGVRPITMRNRLAVIAALPMRPRRNPNACQKPCDLGLFDEAARAQIDLMDIIRSQED